MDPFEILSEYYPTGAKLTRILVDHSRRVADKALAVARQVPHLNPDTTFIFEAAILHDIGIAETDAPGIHCRGKAPYVCHGVIGRKQLDALGLHNHALVCERHVGTGITVLDIQSQNLPLPLRDMQPVTIEETIVCYADKFFSKTTNGGEADLETVLNNLARWGRSKAEFFLKWHQLFNNENEQGAMEANG